MLKWNKLFINNKMPLTDAEITKKVGELRKSEGKIYAPLKYFRGLTTPMGVETRYKKMLRKDYSNFKTDEGQKTKTSSYTQKFRKKYGPEVRSLPEIAKATKIPLKTVKTIYNGEPGIVRVLLHKRGGMLGCTASPLRGRRTTRRIRI
jgi:hypothetical protein